MKRFNRVNILAAILALGGWFTAKAGDTTYSVKVAYLNKQTGEVEGKFIVLPKDLRIVCQGDVRDMFDGDYVKVTWSNGIFKIGKATCTGFKWLQ
jgi:hypothetical protein